MFEVLYLGSIFCALLNIYLLLFSKNALRSYSNYVLSLILFLEVFFVISYLLLYLGAINQVPHLFKVAAPLNFLIPPLAYLYVKSMLLNKRQLSLIETLHFIPFIIVTINYIPFYLLPLHEKRLIVSKVSENLLFGIKYQAGYVSESYLFYFKVLQTLIYLIFQWRVIIKFKKNSTGQNIPLQLSVVVKWVKVFTWIFTCILLGFIFLSLLFSLVPKDHIFQFVKLTQGFLLSTSFFVLSSYILVNPAILIGLPFVKYELTEINQSREKGSRPFYVNEYEIEIKKIEDYMRTSQAFLNPEITIALVAVEMKISTRELSYIINNYHKMRFTDFINRYRVEHFIKMLEEGKLNSYTIEALIKNAGFTSKSSFHSAFKKIYNCTPSQYLSGKKAGFTAL